MLENRSTYSTVRVKCPTVFLVCGAIGAGKTTYANVLAEQRRAVRFSIESWLVTLFGSEPSSWVHQSAAERIERSEEQIWQVVEQLLVLGIDVVLDFGFFTAEQRRRHSDRARTLGAKPVLHFLDQPAEVRRARVFQRNRERNPRVFAVEVTEHMFELVEPHFEPPEAEELEGGVRVD